MKTLRQTIICTALLFIGLTLFTMKEKAPVDGYNMYGFPFRFYTFTYTEKPFGELQNFNILNLLANIALTAGFVFIAVSVLVKIKTTSK